jgi:hypothetical protein
LFLLHLGQLSEHLKLEGDQLQSLQLLLFSAMVVKVVHDGNTQLLLLWGHKRGRGGRQIYNCLHVTGNVVVIFNFALSQN